MSNTSQELAEHVSSVLSDFDRLGFYFTREDHRLMTEMSRRRIVRAYAQETKRPFIRAWGYAYTYNPPKNASAMRVCTFGMIIPIRASTRRLVAPFELMKGMPDTSITPGVKVWAVRGSSVETTQMFLDTVMTDTDVRSDINPQNPDPVLFAPTTEQVQRLSHGEYRWHGALELKL